MTINGDSDGVESGVDYVEYLETGVRPYPFEETIELTKIIIAGIRSREEGGRKVLLSEIDAEVGK